MNVSKRDSTFCVPYVNRVDKSARLSLQLPELAPPAPLFCKRVLPPPLFWLQGGDTLACGRGGRGSQFGLRDRHSGTLGIVKSIYVYRTCQVSLLAKS
jgi:hypothetical protein